MVGGADLLRDLHARPQELRVAGGLPAAQAGRLRALVAAGALDAGQLVLLGSMPRMFEPGAGAARLLAAWTLAAHDAAEAGQRQRSFG